MCVGGKRRSTVFRTSAKREMPKKQEQEPRNKPLSADEEKLEQNDGTGGAWMHWLYSPRHSSTPIV